MREALLATGVSGRQPEPVAIDSNQLNSVPFASTW